ncbi:MULTISPECIES: superinfection immunity protein [unclassified Nesterenkonia]|uniref:superinfection immunity protein n=1 Tax=unclassified Nesterenkonia TaxID=2629769 RepID=UPI00191C71E7|nr:MULTISPECIES: superinfection immunity protein [unclassified Nesterenkonia]MDS2174280.1 superinfection immunity protein [Nesterenkonia sp. CL21]
MFEMNGAEGAIVGIVIVVVGLVALAVYFLPSLVAMIRSHNVGGVFLVNLLLGWSFIGWVVALVMACGSKPQPAQVYVQHQHVPHPPQGSWRG